MANFLRKHFFKMIVFGGLILGMNLSSVQANDYFPMTATELQDALTDAAGNGQDDTITLAAMTYATADNGGMAFSYNAAEDFDLEIVGAGPGLSILDGQGVVNERVISLENTGAGSIRVSGITTQRGSLGADGTGINIQTTSGDVNLGNCEVLNNMADNNVAGVNLRATGGFISLNSCLISGNTGIGATSNSLLNSGDGAIIVSENSIMGNTNDSGGGIDVRSVSGEITFNRNFVFDNHALVGSAGGVALVSNLDGPLVFTNNIVSENTAGSNSGGASLSSQMGEVFAVNNTVVNNTAFSAGGGLSVTANTTSPANIYNNIVFGNHADVDGGQDIFIGNIDMMGAVVLLFNNNFTQLCFNVFSCNPEDLGTNQGANLIGVDPLLVDPAAGDFHLSENSPVIDQATATVPGGLPNPDFDGVTRPVGVAPDMGALEFVPNGGGTGSPLDVFGGGGCQLNRSNPQSLSGLWMLVSVGMIVWLQKRRLHTSS